MLKITLRRETDQISSTFIPISYISNNKKTADFYISCFCIHLI